MSAFWVNRFYVTHTGDGLTRIAFTERLPSGGELVATAVRMTTTDAKELAELILRLAKQKEAN